MTPKHEHINKVETFGCRLNAFESKVIEDNLPKDFTRPRIVFNSCAVTSEAERQVRQAIRKARRKNPNAEIIVTGCAAQINPIMFHRMPEVDRVLGNEEKLDPHIWGKNNCSEFAVNNIMDVKKVAPQLISGFNGRLRAFAQVQQGCDHRCTFCIIPYGRGNSRSVPIGEIVKQAQILINNGYRELVLTGVDITSYGSDLPGKPQLGSMIKRLLANVEGIERLRLSSIDPSELDNDLLDLISNEPRLMPHLHLSIQAGDDLILKRMKRRHSRSTISQISNLLETLRPGIVLGADLIAGFPTETDDMFQRSLDLIFEANLIHLHVFPYSPRQGTPAAKMPQVSASVRKERARILRDAGKEVMTHYLRNRVGSTENVLIEKNGAGYTEHFVPMSVEGSSVPGTIVSALVQKVRETKLIGKVFSEGSVRN
ncbi:MAG: tRNA (N(6)-L-threonylcarbamoyladenosine(37)-C(2))-methylthiotransferase MtaB [Rhodospirillaceae bacterium]|nr:tRNA (N(6)-L-threonylcarbamoyladenosine(37)-C(2))-methylthiotransferase MtaB [Rhodospirillaceae bacterium]|tara:strand:+ start:1402 stop:2682 length:1281 start_codon:yes stop_codon:yes gene_type:complete